MLRRAHQRERKTGRERGGERPGCEAQRLNFPEDDMLTPTGYPPPPTHTAADMAHSTHSTQPALRSHRTTPRTEAKPPQTRRPHTNGLCSPLSEGPDPGSAQRHVNAGSPVQTALIPPSCSRAPRAPAADASGLRCSRGRWSRCGGMPTPLPLPSAR